MQRIARLRIAIRQLVEYSIGAALLLFALHARNTDAIALVIGAALVGVLAASTDGPLGVVRVVGEGLHRLLLLIVALGFAAAPLLTGHPGHIATTILFVGVAAALVRLALMAGDRGDDTKVVRSSTTPGDRAEEFSRIAGQVMGSAARRVETAAHENAFRAGRLIGRLRARS